MRSRRRPVLAVAFVAVYAALAGGDPRRIGPSDRPEVPKTWDDDAIRTLELPLADASASPRHVTAEYYYRIPVRPVYRTYPIYHPDREPHGYLAELARREPEIVFDPSTLVTDADWVRAGELVFDMPIEYLSGELLNRLVRSRAWYARNRVPVTRDGVLPFMRYVVREKGKVEVGILSCGQCHTRVMPDGSIVKGAQGNFPDDRTFAYETRLELARATDRQAVLREFRGFLRRSYAAPWLRPDPNARPDSMSLAELLPVLEAIPPGVCARQGTSIFFPARIPDLIGIAGRRYFDASGHVRHRSIGDVMRYAAINQGADALAQYGDFRPAGGELPDPSTQSRYSDEQLYALALYLYALEPPRNPHRVDALAVRGQAVFERAGCAACHTPPLYTNNRLTPAEGFTVPEAHAPDLDVLPVPVGTDPRLATRSRRGTGFYKVPSLLGVWYRGPFGHDGAVPTLEDWLDPRRLRAEYRSTAVRDGTRRHAVRGHEFGLDLSSTDRRALVAFLKTL